MLSSYDIGESIESDHDNLTDPTAQSVLKKRSGSKNDAIDSAKQSLLEQTSSNKALKVPDIKQSDRAYLSWSNLAYYVPKRAAKNDMERLAAEADVHKGLPKETIREIEGKQYKQIV